MKQENEAQKLTFTTIDDYLPVLNSEAFRNGAEAAILCTQSSRLETGFNIYYNPSFGVYYDDSIIVGCNESLIAHAREKELAKSMFGKDWGKCSLKELSQIFDEVQKTKKTSSLDYPLSEGLKTRSDYFDFLKLDYTSNALTYLQEDLIIALHTHPVQKEFSNNDRPSDEDLRTLHTYKRPSKHNPLMTIFGLNENKTRIPAVLIQEKDNVKIQKYTFFGAALGFEVKTEEALMWRIFGDNKMLLHAYDTLKSNYDVRKGDYIFGKGFELKKDVAIK